MPYLNMSPLGAAPAGGDSPSYANYGGEGFRWGEMEITNTAGLGGGTDILRLLDGATGNNNGVACWWNGGQTLRELTFDWRVNGAIVIDAFKWNQETNATHGTWVLEGSDNLSSWTQIGSSFTLGGTAGDTEYDFTGNVTPYRAHRLRQTAGSTNSGPWLGEIKFRILDESTNHSSYNHTGGTGDRTASITVTTDLALDSGSISNLVDGAFGQNSTDAIDIANGQSGKYIRFDFGTSKIVDGFRWYQVSLASMGTWKLQGSDDAVGWTDIGSTFNLGGSNAAPVFMLFSSTNTTAYRYYQLIMTAGVTATNGPWCQEVEFRIR